MSATSYRPLMGRVLIQREVTKKTAGGIILPDSAQKRHAKCQGKIVALGETAGFTKIYDTDGSESITRILKVGDEVIFGRHAGVWLDASYGAKGEENDDGTMFLCMDEDILAVIN